MFWLDFISTDVEISFPQVMQMGSDDDDGALSSTKSGWLKEEIKKAVQLCENIEGKRLAFIKTTCQQSWSSSSTKHH